MKMSALRVRDAMTPVVFAVGPRTSLETAARLLSMRHISGLPVIDDHGLLLGVVTQSDLVDPDRDRSTTMGVSRYFRVTQGKVEPVGDDAMTEQGVVADIMTPFAVTTHPDAPLLDAVKLMVTDQVHRVFVRDGERLAGVLSSMDVLRAIDRYAERIGME
jgi:CBS domain-containing protein